ncbi:hypothetical protein thsps21_59670 [Pseudomonas sp. No.21]|uniref:hypothetical protein n=1 Tax=Pseudomonas tohonis TaxID=2725477 RepID=UPI001F39B3C4|nr:hypothetical protein [Pseudomonas tohonis]GJN50038.1 hypothetical protein TUM20249_60240 [Pseudomonas tohonis]
MDRPAHIASIILAVVLLLGSLFLANSAALQNPAGVLLLFIAGVFVSFGFIFFGSLKFDDYRQGQDSDSTRSS